MTTDELVDILAERHVIKRRLLDELHRELRRVQDELSALRDQLDAAKETQLVERREAARLRADAQPPADKWGRWRDAARERARRWDE